MVVSGGGQRATPPAQQRRFGNFDALKNTILPSLVRGHQPENRIRIHGDGKLEHMKMCFAKALGHPNEAKIKPSLRKDAFKGIELGQWCYFYFI